MKKDLIIILIICLAIVFLLDNILVFRTETVEIPQQDSLEMTQLPEIKKEFGIPVDSFEIQPGKIKRNQFISSLLSSHGVSYQKIDEIVKKSKGIVDLTKIKYGNPYKFFFRKDSLKTPAYFIYQHTPVHYTIFELGDSIHVHPFKKKITRKLKHVSGVIESSLWNTIRDNDLNIFLVNELSDIFAWTVDFFGLQKGDYFKVVYTEQYVDSISIGIDTVHAALFSQEGNEFYAFGFTQDSIYDFFDEEGNSLRRAFLKAPLKFSRISSGFSYSRLHPILKIRRPHLGVDYAAPRGTPVVALGDGKIIKAAWSGGAGRMIKIKHNSVYTTAYLHLSGFAKGITPGAFVKQGQVIGYVGSTGLSTGPHLDFRCWKNGRNINPLHIESPPVEPVKEGLREEYFKEVDILLEELNSIEISFRNESNKSGV
jgi:murein DD-endopeptidase MepM/ murein hydrolase activator NlpD